MTTRIKISFAAALAVVTMATAAPMLMAQDQPQRRQGPGIHLRQGSGGQVGGPRGGPGGPGGPGIHLRQGYGGQVRRGGPMGLPGFRGLDLSDDQQAQLKQIHESHAAEFQAVRDKSRTAHEGMPALITAETINEAAIRAKSAEIAAAEADLLILNAKIRKEAMQILTAEQLAKLKEQREDRGPRQRRPQAQ